MNSKINKAIQDMEKKGRKQERKKILVELEKMQRETMIDFKKGITTFKWNNVVMSEVVARIKNLK